jgi:glutamine amidotransferase
MCRWLAYSGPAIYLDSLIFEPEHSLISQSRRALRSVSATNGDGFGIGWYDSRPEPGQFRDTLPAWADDNLRNVSAQIRSRLFFAHVRAATGTGTSRANCHPFRHGKWLFMHNGGITGFDKVRHALALRLPPVLFGCLQGTTDSELFFHLLVANGLETGPDVALRRTVSEVLSVLTEAGIRDHGFTMTAALTDGTAIWAVRYGAGAQAPSLYYGCGVPVRGCGNQSAFSNREATLVLSEPLDTVEEHWVPVAESSLLIASRGSISVEPFAPI